MAEWETVSRPKKEDDWETFEVEETRPKGRSQAEKDSTANLSNRLRTWGKGAMLGFQDEGEGLFSTLLLPETEADRIAREITGGEKQSFSDELAMRQADARESQRQYAEDNPWEAGALELTGAVMSPVNRIAPGIGTQGSALTRAVQLAGRGSVEGAVTGFGEGEGGLTERLKNAGTGAAWGAGLGGGLSLGGGYLGRKFSDERVQANLRNLKDQMPLNMADPEGSLGKFYRNVVGLAYGGGGRIGKQESRYLNKATKMARFRDEAGKVVEESTGTRRMVNDVKDRVRDEARVAKDTLDRELKGVQNTDIPKVPKKASKSAIDEQVDVGLAQSRAKMRADQARASIPNHAPDEVQAAVINAENPSMALRELDKYWKSDDAFGGVKQHTYNLDDNLYNFLQNNLDPDVDKAVLNMLDEAYEEGGSTLSGKFLMEMRNRPAIGSGTKTGMQYGKARQSVKKWDKQIERQLKSTGNTPALKQFRADKIHYADFRAYEKATGKAVTRGDIDANWNEQDLWNAGGNKTQRDRQLAPGQDRAKAVKKEGKALKKAVMAQEQQARNAAEGAEKQASLAKAKEKARLENKRKRVNQRERASLNRIDRETEGLLAEDSTFWSRAAATGGLGAPFSGFSLLGAFPTGVAASAALASPRVQRFMAGQGPTQDALREALEQGNTAVVTQILTRIGAMEATEQE